MIALIKFYAVQTIWIKIRARCNNSVGKNVKSVDILIALTINDWNGNLYAMCHLTNSNWTNSIDRENCTYQTCSHIKLYLNNFNILFKRLSPIYILKHAYWLRKFKIESEFQYHPKLRSFNSTLGLIDFSTFHWKHWIWYVFVNGVYFWG